MYRVELLIRGEWVCQSVCRKHEDAYRSAEHWYRCFISRGVRVVNLEEDEVMFEWLVAEKYSPTFVEITKMKAKRWGS